MKELNNKIQELMRSNILQINYEELFKNSEEEVIDILEEFGKYDFNNINDAIVRAAEKGDIKVVKILLEYDQVDPSAWNNYALRSAANAGHIEIVKLLMEDKRVDPSALDNCAIQLAAESGHIEVVKLLLQDIRVSTSVNYRNLIRQAKMYGHTGTAKLIKEAKKMSIVGLQIFKID